MLKTKRLLKIIGEQLAEIIELKDCLNIVDGSIASRKDKR